MPCLTDSSVVLFVGAKKCLCYVSHVKTVLMKYRSIFIILVAKMKEREYHQL